MPGDETFVGGRAAQMISVSGPPYPPSRVVAEIEIDPQRISIGAGDCWPITWADDGEQYSVFCDGEGWEKRRYSMGMGPCRSVWCRKCGSSNVPSTPAARASMRKHSFWLDSIYPVRPSP